jgi:hypothetical protein
MSGMPIDPAPDLPLDALASRAGARPAPAPPRTVDERAARASQAATALLVLAAWLLRAPALLALPALHLAAALALGPRGNVILVLFERLIAPRLAGRRPEDPRPLRFANALGAALLAAALLLHAAGLAAAAWAAAGLVATLALVAAITGFCLGCRFYWVIAALRRAR